MTDESTRSRRVAIAEGEPETFYLKWTNWSHKYKFLTLILGCIFLAATIGPFLSAALYTAFGDLAVMPSFALTRQRALASKDLKIRDFLQKNTKKHCSFIFDITGLPWLDWDEIGNEKAAKHISRSSASTASATSSTCSTASVSLNQDLLKLRPPQSRNYFHFHISGKTIIYNLNVCSNTEKIKYLRSKLLSLSQFRQKKNSVSNFQIRQTSVKIKSRYERFSKT